VRIGRRAFLRCLSAGALGFASRRAAAAGATIKAIAILPSASTLVAGARMGAEEARRTAKLFGRDFELTAEEVRTTQEASAVVLRTSDSVPYLEVTDSAAHAADGRYRLTPLGTDPLIVAWHPDLKRFGAGELNDRFFRFTGRRMDSGAWTAWLAMKMIVEAALYDREIGSLRIDGHKGVLLRFDGQRVLQQPLYRVDADGNLLDS
jgi:hypothetical protein